MINTTTAMKNMLHFGNLISLHFSSKLLLHNNLFYGIQYERIMVFMMAYVGVCNSTSIQWSARVTCYNINGMCANDFTSPNEYTSQCVILLLNKNERQLHVTSK